MSDTEEVKERKPRAPRGQFTTGDLERAKSLGVLDQVIAKHKGNPEFDKVLKAFASSAEDQGLAESLGIREGERRTNRGGGVFVSCKPLGAESEGHVAQVQKMSAGATLPADAMVVTLLR